MSTSLVVVDVLTHFHSLITWSEKGRKCTIAKPLHLHSHMPDDSIVMMISMAAGNHIVEARHQSGENSRMPDFSKFWQARFQTLLNVRRHT